MQTLAVWVSSYLVTGLVAAFGQGSSSFINFETAPIHPLALSPDGRTLAVCNLPDGRVELFDVSSGNPIRSNDVPVGIDPVSVRFRTANELWVVNFISSSVSVIDVARNHVVATLSTVAGPADVVFAGTPERAFVSCARSNAVMVFDPVSRTCLTNIAIDGDLPKAMAITPDGSRVYVAVLESGNASTILVGDALKHPAGPYGGQFPPPNVGTNVIPSHLLIGSGDACGDLPDSLILKKNAAGRWMDDNNGDWTEFVSGTNSAIEARGLFHRPQGWDMPDRDLAIIDTSTFEVTYAAGLMNICMDVAVNPASGMIAVVGTDATNERRFEPNLRGTFIRVNLALVNPVTLTSRIIDLNPHLDYSTSSVPQAVRDQSIGDPRGIIWNSAGTRGYVTGMGSRNLVMINGNGERVHNQPIELGEGPTGMALDETRNRLYVRNRFAATLCTVHAGTLAVLTNVPLHDPTPLAIRLGRKHLYDTRRTSGLGQLACASCHVDARFDRLAWDLSGGSTGEGFHPMKGPLVTQTLQDIIDDRSPLVGKRLHWRGDRDGIEEFNGTFTDLLGKDALLSAEEMQEFKEFLATIHFPPNPFRNFDDSFPSDLPLPGQRNLEGELLPNGNGQRGHELFIANCMGCHRDQNGRGSSGFDEMCHSRLDLIVVTRNGRPFKMAQLRSLPDKLGMDLSGPTSRAGFGFRFDGRDDSLARFFKDIEDTNGSEIVPTNNQELADMTAFLLAFSGIKQNPPDFDNTPSKDAPAAVGRQVTLHSAESNAVALAMLGLAGSLTSRVELVAHGIQDASQRGWLYDRGTGMFQSDRNNESISPAGLLALAAPTRELTLTMVAEGTGPRLGIDRDIDGRFDRTELENGSDPRDPCSLDTNLPPAFVRLADVEIHPGTLITRSVSGAYAAQPCQKLTFELMSDDPNGPTIHPTTGLFTWAVPSAQGAGTNAIAIRIRYDRTPVYVETNTLNVIVVPIRIFEVYRHGTGEVLLRWQAIHDSYYRVQYKDHLEEAIWGFLGGPAIRGHLNAAGVYDLTAKTTNQRFYRILLEQ